LQLARAHGARKVILVELSESRAQAARRIAEPDAVVNPAREDAAARIAEETDGRGADRVIVACSSGKAQEQALTLVARRGSVNFFGGLPVDQPYIKFDSNLLHYGEFYVVGTHGSAPHQNKLALQLLAAGQVRVKELISHRLPLERLREALRLAEAGEGMKVAVVPQK
jgi:L-iditol 2-dehydrogenase